MGKQLRLGVLVPSSNTALEPITQSIISSINSPENPVSVHFSRFPVTQINLSEAGLAQFNLELILPAVQLLADAKVDVIGWSGTSAGWLGFQTDERLCQAIMSATGIPSTTSTLALNKALRLFAVDDIGLVTPYIREMNEAIMENYSKIGVHMDKCREVHLGITDNVAIFDVGEDKLDQMVNDVVTVGGARAVTTFCTNLRAAPRVAYWEKLHGVPVFDTVSTVVWDMLRIVGIDPGLVKGWGQLFERQ